MPRNTTTQKRLRDALYKSLKKKEPLSAQDANLNSMVFSKESLPRSSFLNCDMTYIKLDRTNMTGTDFRKSDLESATCYFAYMDYSDFSNARLDYANFQQATLRGSTFINASLLKTNLGNATLVDSDCTLASFVETRLPLAQMKGATLVKTNFYQAYLSNADLENANLYEASLEKATLSGVCFSGADVTGTNFKDAFMEGAELVHAKNLNLSRGLFFSKNLHRALLPPEYATAFLFEEEDRKDLLLKNPHLLTVFREDPHQFFMLLQKLYDIHKRKGL